MGRGNSLALCSLEWQHFHGCEQQKLPVGATAPVHAAVCAAGCGLPAAHLEKLFFFSQESQAVLWWVFHGTEFGREKHLQPSSPAWQAYPACCSVCSVVKQLVQASVEVLCVELLI